MAFITINDNVLNDISKSEKSTVSDIAGCHSFITVKSNNAVKRWNELRNKLSLIDHDDVEKYPDPDDWMYYPHKCPWINKNDINSENSYKRSTKLYVTNEETGYTKCFEMNKLFCCEITEDDNIFCNKHQKLIYSEKNINGPNHKHSVICQCKIIYPR